MDKEHLQSLLQKYQQGIATREEEQLLLDWLDALETDATDEPIDLQGVQSSIQQHLPFYKKNTTYLKIAAAIIPLIIATYIIWPRQHNNNTIANNWQTITNPTHHIQEIYLPDSTKVFLGAYSTIQYNNTRKVILKEGKAFFDVRTNPDQPFIVSDASGVRTTVLGTSFIAEFSEQKQVSTISVATGKVSVQSGTQKTIVEPNHRLMYFNKKGVLGQDMISSADLIAWTKGETILYKATLSDLILAIREHYGITATTNLDTRNGSYSLHIPPNMPIQAFMEVVEKISYKPKVHFKLQHDQLSIE